MTAEKLITRLNPSTMQYTIGRGGVPALTPQDVAGAAGIVRDKFGFDLACLAHWPDAAQHNQARMLRAVEARQHDEWSQREDALLDAELRLAAGLPGGLAMRGRAQEARWPNWRRGHGHYVGIGVLVVAEVRKPAACHVCDGRGHRMQDAVVRACEHCAGTGRWRATGRARAKLLGMDESTYRQSWRPIYDWTEQMCAEAKRKAMDQLTAALG